MENSIKNRQGLEARIKELEAAEAWQMEQVKGQLEIVKKGLTPAALLKGSFQTVTSSHQLKENAISTSAGVAAGWVARKLFTLNSKNLVRKMLGYGVQFIATKLVTNKMPAIMKKTAARTD